MSLRPVLSIRTRALYGLFFGELYMSRMCIQLFVFIPACSNTCALSCIFRTLAHWLMAIQWPFVRPFVVRT